MGGESDLWPGYGLGLMYNGIFLCRPQTFQFNILNDEHYKTEKSTHFSALLHDNKSMHIMQGDVAIFEKYLLAIAAYNIAFSIVNDNSGICIWIVPQCISKFVIATIVPIYTYIGVYRIYLFNQRTLVLFVYSF